MSDLTSTTHGASTALVTTSWAREHAHELLGQRSVGSYDGSWTEDGFLVGVPIETGDPAAS